MDSTRRRTVGLLTRLLGIAPVALATGASAAQDAPEPSTPRADPGQPVPITAFGARGDGSGDQAEAFEKAFAWVANVHRDTGAATPRIFVPPGVYAYRSSPNFAVTNLALECAPGVIFRHTGDGPAFLLDGGADSDGVYRTQILGSPTIQGNARTTYGIDLRALHHAVVSASVRDVGQAVLRTRWAVATEFRVRSTGLGINGNNPVPLDGLVLDRRKPSEDTVACLFHLPIIEQVRNIGIRLAHAGNCTFLSGTSESNGVGGVHVSSASSCNTFIGLDLEFNGKYGILCEGDRNGFVGLFDDKLSTFAGKGNWVKGNQFGNIVNTGDGNAFESLSYSANGGTFTDRGTNTRKSLVRNLTSGLLDPDRAGRAAEPVALPSGGAVQDEQAREALAALVARLQAAGILG